MRGARLCLALLAMAVPAAAEVVTVSSGEHPGFSRLVMKLPPGAGWDIRREGRSVRVSVSARDVVFDVDSVFKRIPRKRLLSVRAESDRADLALALGCDCRVRTFVEGGNFLVIDITDEPAPKPRRFYGQVPANAGPYRFSRWPSPGRGVALGELLREDPGAGPRDDRSPNPARTVVARFPLDLFPLVVKSAWRERLIASVKRVARLREVDGMDDFVPMGGSGADLQMASERAGEPPAGPSGTAADAGGAPLPVDADDGAGNLRVTVAGMRDEGLLEAALELGRRKPSDGPCAVERLLRAANWADGDDFSGIVARQISQLYGEFDRLDPEAAKRLAKAYLRFGFGSEAGRVLEMLPEAGEEVRLLRDLARIMDAPPAEPKDQASAIWPSDFDCGDSVTFWRSLLADRPLGKGAGDKIARAFLELPVALREHLGPRVVRLLVADGLLDPARIVSRSWERAAGMAPKVPPVPVSAMPDGGGPDGPLSMATMPPPGDIPETPYRLLDLVARGFRAREALPEDVPELIASYALEYRRTQLGDMLAQAHVIALALNGRFDEAFSAADAAPGSRGRETAPEVRSGIRPASGPDQAGKLFTLLTEKADDITFLRHALPLADAGAAARSDRRRGMPALLQLPEDVAAAVARRLHELGFVDEARAITADKPMPDA